MVPSGEAVGTGLRDRPEEGQAVRSKLVLGLKEQTNFCLKHGAVGWLGQGGFSWALGA